MAISNAITSIEEHIVDAYDAINISGIDTSQIDRNIENISKKIKKSYVDIINNGTDTLYANFPKISKSGTDLELATEEGKMKVLLNPVELEQDEKPTSDNPQDIHVITGNNNIKIHNKNFFNQHENIWYNVTTGKFTNSDNFRSFIAPVQPNKTYTISKKNISNRFVVITGNNEYPSADVFYLRILLTEANTSRLTYTFTTDENEHYVLFGFYNGTNTEEIEKAAKEVQIEESLVTTNYVSHQEQNYPITLSSKNLFGLTANDFNNGQVVGAGKKVTLTLKPNTEYTLSSSAPGTSSATNIWFNGTSSQTNGVFDGTSKTFSTDSNGDIYIMVRETEINNIFDNFWIQLEEGLTSTKYVPYIANPIEYCKINDYADQLFKNTSDSEFYDNTLLENEWYLKKNIYKVVFDGSDDEVYDKVYGSIYNNKCLYYLKNIPHNNSNYNLMKSNRFVATGGVSEYYPEGINVSFNAGYLGLVLEADKLTEYTTDALRTFFQINNTDVYLVSSTPQYIHISETDYPVLREQLENLYNNAKSYEDKTYITVTNDNEKNLLLDVEVTALKNS